MTHQKQYLANVIVVYTTMANFQAVLNSSVLKLYVQPISMSAGQVCNQLDVFFEQIQCSRVKHAVMSVSDVALTDTESSDTATESPE